MTGCAVAFPALPLIPFHQAHFRSRGDGGPVGTFTLTVGP